MSGKKEAAPVSSLTDLLQQVLKNPQLANTLPVTKLEQMIIYANQHYEMGTPVIPDSLYDYLRYTVLPERAPKSPILQEDLGGQVGLEVTKDRVRLPYWMGSMSKIKPGTGELEKWKAKYQGPYFISGKLDGISALLVVTDKDARLYSRGNGVIGTDLTPMLEPLGLMPSIHKIQHKLTRSTLAVRGELVMKKATFQDKYSQDYANARNLVAGTMNAKHPNAEVVSDIDLVLYEMIEPNEKVSVQFRILNQFGLHTPLHTLKADISDEILSQVLLQFRERSPYEIDGIVVVDDQKHPRNQSGNPKYAFAFKMILAEQHAETTVLQVEWNASKDGVLKPRIKVEPVRLSGATIRYVTGFNGKFIQDNRIGPGAVIKVIRSGDVIPHIMGVVHPAAQPQMPDEDYSWSPTGVEVILAHKSDDPAVRLQQIVNFFHKVDAKNVSKGILSKLFAEGADTIPKILDLSVADLESKEGIKHTLAEKIYHSMHQAVRGADLLTLMVASNRLGRGLGGKKLKLLLVKYPDILHTHPEEDDEWVKEIITINGFSDKTAQLFVDHFPFFMEFLQTLAPYIDPAILLPQAAAPVSLPPPSPPKSPKAAKAGESASARKKTAKKATGVAAAAVAPQTSGAARAGKMAGHTVVMTQYRDKGLQDWIQKEGGEVDDNISRKTTIVIAKDLSKKTGKLAKAFEKQQQGQHIAIMTPQQFQDSFQS